MYKHILLLFVLFASTFSKTIEYNWDITYVKANPDGLFERRVIGVNNDYPIKPLEGQIGDTILVNVRNSLDRPTSLHAHGISFYNNVFSDGASSVNNCPIMPGYNYTYKIELTEQGTYWFHSHSGTDYADGLRAPLIVYPTNQTKHFEYDDEFILTLSDWYHEEVYNLGKFLSSDKNPGAFEPPPNSGVLNDRPQNVFNISTGKTYRVRLINTSTMGVFHIKVDGHSMSMIEVDGVDIQPVAVSSIMVSPAQRVSFLFTAKETDDFNYYIHADMDPNFYDSIPESLQMNLTATLNYKDSNSISTPEVHEWDDANDMLLIPMEEQIYQEPSEEHIIVSDIMQLDDGAPHGLINGVTYRPPKVPVILSMLTTGENATNPAIYGPKSNAFVTGFNNTVRIVIENVHMDPHPFHLHAHKFQIISVGKGEYANAPKIIPKDNWNPVRRDVVMVPAMGYVVLQFISNSPGAWPIHCHNNWHMIWGMMGVIVEAPLEAQKMYQSIPQSVIDTCTRSGFMVSGNGGGGAGFDLSNAPNSPNLINYGIHAKGIIAIIFCIIAAIIGILSTLFYSKQVGAKIAMDKRALLQPDDQQ
ncbi:hypothetical protein BB559_004749 [Furculomyces boomerangus]|uniref:Uncharacterized protein n=2 Tax=Harpellales TaxID=61421 RepID=A0A2T9YCW0_9FUNG|nr:hypothetical protein BB559_004749 [Furculomyces boomerangus]PVZ99243.1 hypothetical protein BB558_004738 [Smittium angustum]